MVVKATDTDVSQTHLYESTHSQIAVKSIWHLITRCVQQSKCAKLRKPWKPISLPYMAWNCTKALCIWKWMCVCTCNPQRQGWEAAVSSPPCPPTQRPSHQVGGWQSTLIGQLRPPVHWKQQVHGFPSQKMISISSSPHISVAHPCCRDEQGLIQNRELPWYK